MINVYVMWGESPEDDSTPSTYTFATQAEVDAFLLGVAEMDGWLGYEVLDHPRHVVRKGEIIDLDKEHSE